MNVRSRAKEIKEKLDITGLTCLWQNQQECYFSRMNEKMKNGCNDVQTQNTALKIFKSN